MIGLTNNRMDLIKYRYALETEEERNRYGRHFYLKTMGNFSDLPKEIEDWIQTCIIIYTVWTIEERVMAIGGLVKDGSVENDSTECNQCSKE